MTAGRIIACFLNGARGRILVVARFPASGSGRAVLVVPPFAEEMNKSRRMVTEVASRLVKSGIATIVPDLFGTGDSEGEFSAGDWEVWQQDVALAATWAAEVGWPVFALLGIRLGGALAAESSRNLLGPVTRTVLWAPVLDGARFLTQFLRLRVAASMMEDGGSESVAGLRERLQRGETIEVSGYSLSPTLVRRVDKVTLVDQLGPHAGAVHWIEIMRSEEPAIPESTRAAIALAGNTVQMIKSYAVSGDPFWSTTEIAINAELVDKTVAVLTQDP